MSRTDVQMGVCKQSSFYSMKNKFYTKYISWEVTHPKIQKKRTLNFVTCCIKAWLRSFGKDLPDEWWSPTPKRILSRFIQIPDVKPMKCACMYIFIHRLCLQLNKCSEERQALGGQTRSWLKLGFGLREAWEFWGNDIEQVWREGGREGFQQF